MVEHPFLNYQPERFSPDDMLRRATAYYEQMTSRRSVRHFSADPVPRQLIEQAIMTASSSPSGANRQPWRFIAISDPKLRSKIRIAAEAEERKSYEGGRMPAVWREAIAHFETDWRKPYLEVVPWIVVVFEETYRFDAQGNRQPNYYVKESVGMACGLFIAAIHNMGLATLTHTPSPMGFLAELLGRPENERPFVLFPVGYPSPEARVPDQPRKTLEEIAIWYESPGATTSSGPGTRILSGAASRCC